MNPCQSQREGSVLLMQKTIALGVIGHPVSHSLSPLMHLTAAKSLGLDLTYDTFDVPPEELEWFMRRFCNGDMDGLNVTVPHKIAVMEYMDELMDSAEKAGAVNTICRKGRKLIGANTDGYGFITSVERNAGKDVAHKKILVYGAGGAARAVCHAFADRNVERLLIANRTRHRAETLVDSLVGKDCGIDVLGYESNNLVDSVRSADIIVNTTSVGMESSSVKSLPGSENIHQGQLVVDIVYRPLETPLLRQAKRAGANTLDGLWMLIHQGARSFTLWTGAMFPVELARVSLLKALNKD